MPHLRSWFARLLGLVRKDNREAGMAEEIRQHLNGLTKRNVAAGMSPEEARYAALREFGGIEQIKESAREERVWISAEQLWRDLRFALRMLAKQPGFTIIATLTLALGIGANTAIFGIVNAVLLRPLPFPEPDRIIFLSEADKTNPDRPGVAISLPDYLDWRRDNTVFENLAVSLRNSTSLSGIPGRDPEQIGAAFVTSNFFKVIGVRPQLGRVFNEEEDKVGAPFLVVISDHLWEHVFNRNPSVIGQAVTFQGRSASIVGVMPPEMTWPQEPDAWFSVMRRSDNGAWANRSIRPGLLAWGRLKPGVSLERARSEMTAIAARLEQAHPESNTDVTVKMMPVMENLVGKYRVNLSLLLGAVALVLLIACANLANLFAARGASRAREFAIRAAVGARRAQIVRQLLVESLVIALFGGLLGFLIALWSRDLLSLLAPQDLSRFKEVSFNGGVLGFTLLLATLTSVLFGLWPAWQASHFDVQDGLKAGAHGSSDTPSARRTRDWLVIADIALTLVLLSSAGLVLKSFSHLQAVDLGFEPRGLMTARIDLPYARYADHAKIVNFCDSLVDKIKAIPGIDKVAMGANPPFFQDWSVSFVRSGIPAPIPGQEPSAQSEVIAGDYLGTCKTPLLRGRALNERDTKNSPLVVMIDQTMAERFFRGEDPIGQQLSVDPDGSGSDNRWFQIVGVVGRMRFRSSIETETPPVIYFSMGQVQRRSLVLLARTSIEISSFEKTVRAFVAGIDPTQPVYSIRSMSWRVGETRATQRLLAFLLVVFAVLALLLASVGLYGVLSYTALRRLREIGLRLALGARPAQIRALIFNHGLRLLLIGCACGLFAAVFIATILRSVLFEMTPLQPAIYLLVAAILTLATLIACWLPAARACRTDPMVVLRDT
jgi:putative ABC transport system permease protein